MSSTLDAQPSVTQAEPDARRNHMQILVLCAAVIVASAVLNVEPRGITIPGLRGHPLPGICATRALFHMNCPGCGITRSFVAVAHGELRLGFALHRLGPFVFLLVLLQVPLRAYGVLTGKMGRRHFPQTSRKMPPSHFPWLIGGLLIALVANWLYNLITGAVFRVG